MSHLRMTEEQVAERASKLSKSAKLAKVSAPPEAPARKPKNPRQGIQPALPLPTEHDVQVAFFQWWKFYSAAHKIPECLCWANPNSTPDARDRQYKTAEGLRRGVPDVFLALPRGGFHGCFLEFKRTPKSPVNAEQKEYMAELRRQFYQAHLITQGFDEAVKIVTRYIEYPYTR